jgi:SfnB family sulfur acquisition oxidoreductase
MPDDLTQPPARPRPPARPAHRIASDAEAIESARALAERFRAGAAQRDRERLLPWAEIDAFSASGLGGITVPRAFGGPDLSNVTLAEVIATLAAADGSLGQLPQNQLAFYRMLHYTDAEDVKRWVYPRALEGYRFSAATAETQGRTTKDISAGARRDGEGWIISGRKGYGTAALFAHYVGVQVLDEAGRGTRAIIPADAPGLTVVDDWSAIGQRTTASGTILMENVRLPADHVFSTAALAEQPTLYGPISQLIQAAIDLGLARGAIADTITFVRTRSRPWIDSGQDRASDDPYTIAAVGDLEIRLHAAEAMLARAGALLDAATGQEDFDRVAACSIAVAEAKVLTTEIAILATNKLFELAGTRAALAEHGLDRWWRDARTHTLHDPVRWKFHHVGNYYLNGVRPPRHAWI